MRNITFRKAIVTFLTALIILVMGLTYYADRSMPHGPMIDTGDVVCQNDDRGPCKEQYIEETSKVNIPEWAKFLRRYNLLVILPLIVLTLYINERLKHRENTKEPTA